MHRTCARVSFVFYFLHFFCTYIRDVRFEKLSGEKFRINGGEKNVVVNIDGGFQYSGNYVVTRGGGSVFLGYLPNEDFSVESKKII